MFIFYLLILATNIAIEIGVTALIGKYCVCQTPLITVVLGCLSLNLVTHPIASIAFYELTLPILPIELFIFLMEALGYKLLVRASWRISFLMSGLANLVTFAAGLFFI